MGGDIREFVRKKYAAAITQKTGCCSGAGCCGGAASEAANAVTGNLYGLDETAGLPEEALKASFGCGNPTALADLYAGETVLDLGSGAGLDVLLSARRVGEHGKAYGLDMTKEMLAAANANKEKAGIANAEFLKGHIEEIPLPDNAVDVVISNCVINLSADKDKVFAEIFRVLKPGGRVAVSDIVTTRKLPEKLRCSLLAWAGCVAGALTDAEYKAKLAAAGFTGIELAVTRIYDLTAPEIAQLVPEASAEELQDLNGAVVSAFIRAKKPARRLKPGQDYRLRTATPGDFPEIQRLLQASGLPLAGVEDNIGNFFVAETERIAGVIGLEHQGQAAMLRSLAVEAAMRKAGLAAALVERALAAAREAGAKDVYLLTNTAQKYFERLGFKTISRDQVPPDLLSRSALSGACPVTSTSMTLRL